MGKPLCISADSHIVESAEFFEPLAKQFGDVAPRMVIADPARGPQLYGTANPEPPLFCRPKLRQTKRLLPRNCASI